MYPVRTQSRVAELLIVTVLFAVGAPRAWAHGGGGGGHGGRSGHGGASGAYFHPYTNHHGYTSGAYFGRGSGSAPSQPAWEGFPEDLPFARLQRFFANHLHHFHITRATTS